CQVNQVKYLAEKAGVSEWCYGDNYSFGIPGIRVRSGNAILSKLPLRALRVDALPGKPSVWNPTGQRRLPWASVEWAGSTILLGSIRNDSFDLENNALQVRSILESLPESPVILGGDFNAEPGDESMERLKRSGHWRGVFQGAATFPSHAPHRRIDSVLIPSAWPGTLEQRVLDVDLSDHEPALVTVTLR
ncbi:MAG: endonuclease/exonuclease/phosphatase family protein, partial [Planctomycetota bacterium]|nr:endonuclease/exonuclease/phosphatase family protein [Planctomycetota bacterium]